MVRCQCQFWERELRNCRYFLFGSLENKNFKKNRRKLSCHLYFVFFLDTHVVREYLALGFLIYSYELSM